MKNSTDYYSRVEKLIPRFEWDIIEPYVLEIEELKKQKNAVILAHNYQNIEIFNCVADYVGDSLELARIAVGVDADIIVQAGVNFMAETSKLLSPDKKVLSPDLSAGCSLADSITAEDVKELKRQHPGCPVVTYVNTTADVKAESDVCCTSSNAIEIIEKIAERYNAEEVIFIPDQYLASYVSGQTDVKIIPWRGSCIVHERFDKAQITSMRSSYPKAKIIAHPECPKEVLDSVDYTGSTKQLFLWLRDNNPDQAIVITECSMVSNLSLSMPEIDFIKPCNYCPYMQKITLPKIRDCLKFDQHEIVLDSGVSDLARKSLDLMISMSS